MKKYIVFLVAMVIGMSVFGQLPGVNQAGKSEVTKRYMQEYAAQQFSLYDAGTMTGLPGSWWRKTDTTYANKKMATYYWASTQLALKATIATTGKKTWFSPVTRTVGQLHADSSLYGMIDLIDGAIGFDAQMSGTPPILSKSMTIYQNLDALETAVRLGGTLENSTVSALDTFGVAVPGMTTGGLAIAAYTTFIASPDTLPFVYQYKAGWVTFCAKYNKTIVYHIIKK